jgi:hypothetical protein
MKTKEFTIAAVAPVTALDAEFIDFPGLERGGSIKRGLAYKLIADGEIRSVVLRRKGRIRGKRLIDVESVRKWFASQPIRPDAKFTRHMRAANKLSVAKRRQNRADAVMA